MKSILIIIGVCFQFNKALSSFGNVRNPERRPYFQGQDDAFVNLRTLGKTNRDFSLAQNDFEYIPEMAPAYSLSDKQSNLFQSNGDSIEAMPNNMLYQRYRDMIPSQAFDDGLEANRRQKLERMLSKTLDYIRLYDEEESAINRALSADKNQLANYEGRNGPQRTEKRDSSAGSNICIWKVCPPSPWRRSKADDGS